MEEEKKIESEESEKPTTVTFDLGIVAFFTALGSLALNLIFIFIFLCGATGATRAFDIIEIIVFIIGAFEEMLSPCSQTFFNRFQVQLEICWISNVSRRR